MNPNYKYTKSGKKLVKEHKELNRLAEKFEIDLTADGDESDILTDVQDLQFFIEDYEGFCEAHKDDNEFIKEITEKLIEKGYIEKIV